jgi:BirA family transcriptional regulator, biotin operon repressor / biotin---[acetyl-CoA-carboxylase] ligase
MKHSGVSEFRFLLQTGSTNEDALAWAEDGAPDGAVVAADSQTRGRGRLERRWVTKAGSALAFSVIFRPTVPEAAHAGLFSALGGLAVAEALRQGWGVQAQIKWPNDVLVERRKVCGILAESVWQAGQLQTLVLGIGVNVAPSSVPPPAEVLYPAGCVEDFTGEAVDRWELLAGILKQIRTWRGRLGQPDFMEAWQRTLAFRGETVQVELPDRILMGEILGVDPAGGLRLRCQDGSEETVWAGDVHLRPAA